MQQGFDKICVEHQCIHFIRVVTVSGIFSPGLVFLEAPEKKYCKFAHFLAFDLELAANFEQI